jgi:hypothetical protein
MVVRCSLVPDHLEVGVLPPYNRTAYPGVFLFTTVVRTALHPPFVLCLRQNRWSGLALRTLVGWWCNARRTAFLYYRLNAMLQER